MRRIVIANYNYQVQLKAVLPTDFFSQFWKSYCIVGNTAKLKVISLLKAILQRMERLQKQLNALN